MKSIICLLLLILAASTINATTINGDIGPPPEIINNLSTTTVILDPLGLPLTASDNPICNVNVGRAARPTIGS